MRRVLLFILPILIIVSVAFTLFGFFQARLEEEKLTDDLKRKARTVAESMELSVKHVLLGNDLNIRQQVMWPTKSIDFVRVKEDKEGKHYGLFVNNNLTSIISIFQNENKIQFRKFATLQNEQGKGYGTRLLNFIFDKYSKNGIKQIWCNARVNKSNFYRKFGMKKTENSFTKEGIEYFIMEKIF